RGSFVKKQNPGDRHDGGAAGEDCRHGRKRSPFLKQKKERNCPGSNTDSSENRIVKTGTAEFLIPASAKPKHRQINQNRQGGARFDYEATEPITNSLGGE